MQLYKKVGLNYFGAHNQEKIKAGVPQQTNQMILFFIFYGDAFVGDWLLYKSFRP